MKSLTPSRLAVVCLLSIGTPRVTGLQLSALNRLVPDPAIPSTGQHILTSTAGGDDRPLVIAPEDRKRHLYVVGSFSRGKTTLLENLIVDDPKEGFGLGYIDLKGDSVPRILDRIPPERLGDVVLFDPADSRFSVGFNVLAGDNPYAVADQIVGIFDALYNLGGARVP